MKSTLLTIAAVVGQSVLAADEGHTIKLHRPAKVGEQLRVEIIGSESNTMTGFPSAKAVAAALIGFKDSIALTLRRGQTTPLFSVPRPRSIFENTSIPHHRCDFR